MAQLGTNVLQVRTVLQGPLLRLGVHLVSTTLQRRWRSAQFAQRAVYARETQPTRTNVPYITIVRRDLLWVICAQLASMVQG